MAKSRFAGIAIAGGLLLSIPSLVTSIAAQPGPAGHKVATLEIKILSTMVADDGFGEWGFAALVAVDGRRILFDTGANDDTVQRNLKAMGLDLTDVEMVILSHNHDDHTTGLLTLRRQFAAKSPKAIYSLHPPALPQDHRDHTRAGIFPSPPVSKRSTASGTWWASPGRPAWSARSGRRTRWRRGSAPDASLNNGEHQRRAGV